MGQKVKKQIKKKFFPVTISILNKEIELLGTDIKSLDNRFVKLDLTHDLKGRAFDLKLIVTADEKEASARPIQINLFQSYVRRMVRKGTDYSEDSIITKTKDYKVTIKPLMITRKRVARAILNGLRKKAREEIIFWAQERTFEQALSEILSGELQKSIQPKLKKIYPLSLFEIKYFGINKKEEYQEPDKKEKTVKKTVKKEEVEESSEI